ncbi:hypothetical protein, partial [Aliarcobacter butzleri]|uniref:hypothetical protein n=1 Tax=Aliarcobacter butzleri TaxID=28197 RepID=UPI0021B2ABCB
IASSLSFYFKAFPKLVSITTFGEAFFLALFYFQPFTFFSLIVLCSYLVVLYRIWLFSFKVYLPLYKLLCLFIILYLNHFSFI